MTTQPYQGLLIDLEGVLYVGSEPIPGAVEAIENLNAQGFPHCYVTNTTTRSRHAIAQKLQDMGFAITANQILTTPAAAATYLKEQRLNHCAFYVDDAIRDEFREIGVSESEPDAVIIGDIGKAWDYELINKLFNQLIEGARLIALHKGKYWLTADGLQVDIGAFIAGLEYAASVKAEVIGKPSIEFFQAAAQAIDIPQEHLLMIGDDLESDVGGAQSAGMLGALVKTGKYRSDQLSHPKYTPDLILDSIAELKNLI